MEYINPIWFYLMDAANGIKIFSWIVVGILIALTMMILAKMYIDGDIISEEGSLCAVKKLVIAIFIFMIIGILTPNQTSVCEMMLSHYIPAEELLEQDANKFFTNMEKYVEDIINR